MILKNRISKCPCDDAPYPWCNNGEGCFDCPDFERWAEENWFN